MRWPWSRRVEEAEMAADEAERQAQEVRDQWPVVYQEVGQHRRVRQGDQFIEMLHTVARGGTR